MFLPISKLKPSKLPRCVGLKVHRSHETKRTALRSRLDHRYDSTNQRFLFTAHVLFVYSCLTFMANAGIQYHTWMVRLMEEILHHLEIMG